MSKAFYNHCSCCTAKFQFGTLVLYNQFWSIILHPPMLSLSFRSNRSNGGRTQIFDTVSFMKYYNKGLYIVVFFIRNCFWYNLSTRTHAQYGGIVWPCIVQQQCVTVPWMMIQYDDAVWWYSMMIQYDDIVWWYSIMIQWCDTDFWNCLTIS